MTFCEEERCSVCITRLGNKSDAVRDVDEDVARGVDGTRDAAEKVESEHPAEQDASEGHARLDLDTHQSKIVELDGEKGGKVIIAKTPIPSWIRTERSGRPS